MLILQNTHVMTNTLNYSTRTINLNTRIKIYGNGLNKLVGVRGFMELVNDDDLCNRLLDRVFNTSVTSDKMVCKLRRGVKITFYYR